MTKGVQLGNVLPVNAAIANCLRSRGIPIEEAAKRIHRSPRQLARDIKGQNKIGVTPGDTVRELYEADLIDEETKNMWPDSARQAYNLKRAEQKPLGESGLKQGM